MTRKNKGKGSVVMKTKILFILLSALGCLIFSTLGVSAQTAQPSPSPSSSSSADSSSSTESGPAAISVGGYNVTSSVEFGIRGLEVNGNHNKYRSDFNYKPGFRLFDSSFLMEAGENKKGGFFDSMLVTTSGWNSDPTGTVRVNVEKTGIYRFDSNVRRVKYFNNLINHARNTHTNNIEHDFGDFDLTIFPTSQKLRFRLGMGFNDTDGTGTYTTRFQSDEFAVNTFARAEAMDLRAAVEGRLLGFNVSLGYGFRRFSDDTSFRSEANPGLNTTNQSRITIFDRFHPIRGATNYGIFNAQRTFAKKLDFTARVIYSLTDRDFGFFETITGRDNTNPAGNFIDLDRFEIRGDAKRPQTRGDLGLTFAVTDKLRISETFTFDTFNITGGNAFAQAVTRRTAAGGPLASQFTNSLFYRLTGFRRFVNTVEADYQFNRRFGVNVGYRFTHRRVNLMGFDQPLPPATNLTRTIRDEKEENQTNTLIAGTRIKPLDNWSIFADMEIGESDNAFTRLANYKFTNLRLRSIWRFNRFAFNLSAITKDNENPSFSTTNPIGDFIANTKSRIFSGYVDWTPVQKLSVSAGYTYQHLTSETDIVVPLATLTRGLSQYYMRDHYAFFDVTVQPVKRVSLFAGYRLSNDLGQGERFPAAPQFIISSYPYTLHAPEFRAAVRLTRNIDWNVGYQFFDYNEDILSTIPPPFPPFTVPAVAAPPAQNYRAHLPYTSLRIYFGRKE
jgi:hypothetical protein